MKTLIKYLLLAILFVAGSCGERIVGLGDDELVTISEESLNYNVTGGHVTIANYSGKETVVLVGTTIDVVAVPESGYEFIGWFVGNSDTPVSVNKTYSFAVNKNATLVAKFGKLCFVSVGSGGNGSVVIKDFAYTSMNTITGTEVTVVATPNANFEFLGWFIGDSETPVSTDATYTFIVEENVSLVAKFNKWPLVSISSGGNGAVSFENSADFSQFIQPGSEVTIVATPDANCDFRGWFIGDAETPVSTDATYTFIVEENVSLVAKFNKWPLVSISSGGNGTVSFENSAELSQYVQPGSELTVVAAPDANYDFLGWFIGNAETPVSTDLTYTFTVKEGVALVAKFNKWPLVSISSGGNGTVSFENSAEFSQFIQPGSELTVVAAPDANCDFLGWFIGDAETPISTDATYTFTVSEGVALVAKFSKWPLVSISSGGNGTVSFENSSELSQFVQPGSEVTVVASPEGNYDFFGWFVGDSEEPVSTDLTYTFTVSEGVALVAKFYKHGYEYVDLGLPSGVKWAAYNVGATKPEEYGGYYAWGETEKKSNYSWETYKWCNGSKDTMTKYCTDSSYGTVDNKTVLDPEDDVAHVKWGGSWRMPTEAEQDELLTECNWEWTTLNGVNGYKVTGPNGNSIFLPAAGFRDGTEVSNRGIYSLCWSGSLGSNWNSNAYYFLLNSGFKRCNDCGRYYGLSVRPVCK